jgi:hypothetical protein
MTHWSPSCWAWWRQKDLSFFSFFFFIWEEGQSDGIDTEEAERQCSKRQAAAAAGRHPNPSSGCYRTPLSGVVVAEHDLDQRELAELFDSFRQIPK